MQQTVKWLPQPEMHDYQAAEIRGCAEHPLIIADGYHRVCASYWIDENTDIPCILI
jgi:hypothetical protein